MQNVAVFNELNVYENIDYFCGLYITDKKSEKAICTGSNRICRFAGLYKIPSEKTIGRSAQTTEYSLWHCPQTKAYHT